MQLHLIARSMKSMWRSEYQAATVVDEEEVARKENDDDVVDEA